MNNISIITQEIILSDEIHLEALRLNTLNLRAYASLIKDRVEESAHKEVKLNSIVIALSRIRKNLKNIQVLRPEAKIENLSIKSDLSVVTYEKTADVLSKLSKLSAIERRDKDFFVIAEGLAEITIVGSIENINIIEKEIGQKYKIRVNDAVAVTIRFDEKYIEIPNVLYNFVSSLAIKRVNLLQVVSNLTEVSFIISKKYMNDTVDVFKRYLSSSAI